MSNLVVLGFDGMHTADEVLNKLRSLQREYLIDLEDACVVEREKSGKVYIKQAVNLMALGAAAGGSRGALWGAIVGLLFLNPLAGMAIGAITGAGAGALSGSLADYGIPDDFVKKLGETIRDALYLAAKSDFDAIVMDRMLPGLDGIAVIKALRQRRPGLPIIAISGVHLDALGTTALSQLPRGIDLSGVTCLTKPIRGAELFSVIDKVLKAHA